MPVETSNKNAAMPDLWRRFKLRKDTKARDQIINHYAYLVKITAGRVVTSLPPNLERDDLVSAGVMGLIKAVDQFDTNRQVKFETYAIALIRGAILEMLREEDWVPRSVRDNVKTLERTYYKLEVQLGRPATEDEVAAEMGMTADDLQKLLVNTSRANVLSLDDMLLGGGSGDGERLHLTDVLQDENANVLGDVETAAMKETLTAGIDRLPDRERLVIALYYYEGLTFKEIGKVLAVSESRVYQLHTQAVLRLRGYLQRDTLLFTS
jgi:RNA polymerase sigma factor for flagellar operon FliA